MAADGRGRCHSICKAQVSYMLFVFGQFYGYGTAQGCYLHGSPFSIFNVMAAVSFIILFFNPDGNQHFLMLPHGPARPGVPLADRHFPYALWSF